MDNTDREYILRYGMNKEEYETDQYYKKLRDVMTSWYSSFINKHNLGNRAATLQKGVITDKKSIGDTGLTNTISRQEDNKSSK